jgi:hypothetical protein
MPQICSYYLHTKGKVLQADVLLKNSIANIREGYQVIREPYALTLIMICPYIN